MHRKTIHNETILGKSLDDYKKKMFSNWKTKKAGNGENNPGLSVCASGLTTIHDALQKEEWNEEEIKTRAEWLCEQARTLWDMIDGQKIDESEKSIPVDKVQIGNMDADSKKLAERKFHISCEESVRYHA